MPVRRDRGAQTLVNATQSVRDVDVAGAVARMDAWLETMRGPHGYGGPIAHWWESNLVYTGAMYDWRYEGVIQGYLALYARTEDAGYLDKAMRAGDEAVRAMLPDGRFRRSSFQFGPVRGGTPHEAAVDVALLRLTRVAGTERPDAASRYLEAALRNLDEYYVDVLWTGSGFRDQPYNPVLVANKHGTLLEAWLLVSELTGRDVEPYVRACVAAVAAARVDHGPQAGGVVHLGIGPSRLAIPIYVARAMNGILSYHAACGDRDVVPLLTGATNFLQRTVTNRGVVWGVYGTGRICRNPEWIAGAGDVLRFLRRMGDRGLADTAASVASLTGALVAQQRPSGGIPTSHGFARKGLAAASTDPEFRDELPVVGWVDKAFRAIAELLPEGAVMPSVRLEPFERSVRWRGRRHTYVESEASIRLLDPRNEVVYLWRKGRRAPDVLRL